jgi:modulator of FtsH protease
VIGDWETFFAAQAGAMAALAGLVFVALSINLRDILGAPGLTGRAAEAIILMVQPVIAALLVLIPNQGMRALGIELLVLGAGTFVSVNVLIWNAFDAIRARPPREIATRLTLAELAVLPTIIAGALLIDHSITGLDWQAVGAILCLCVGIIDAWVLLVEILR